jgi:hypothetical protein
VISWFPRVRSSLLTLAILDTSLTSQAYISKLAFTFNSYRYTTEEAEAKEKEAKEAREAKMEAEVRNHQREAKAGGVDDDENIGGGSGAPSKAEEDSTNESTGARGGSSSGSKKKRGGKRGKASASGARDEL